MIKPDMHIENKDIRPDAHPSSSTRPVGLRPLVLLASLILVLLCSPTAAENFAEDLAEDLELLLNEPATLEELIIEADSNNQAYRAAQARFERFEARIPIMKLLDEPLLAFYYLDFPVGNMSGGSVLRLNQSKGIGAKLVEDAKKVRGKILDGLDMVENQALWYRYVSEDLRLQTYRKVKEFFYRLYYHDRIIALTRENLRTLEAMVRTSQSRYAVGQLSQAEVLRTQVQRSLLLGELMDVKLRRVELVNELNALTARPANSTLVPMLDAEPALKSLPELGKPPEEFLKSLIHRRPLLKGYQALGGRLRSMEMMVKMYFNRDVREEAVFEVDSALRTLRADRNEFYNRLQAEIVTTTASLEKNRKHAQLYAEVTIPLAQQVHQSSLADYRVGKGDYNRVLQSLLELHNYQVSHLQTLTNYQVDLARLESAAGLLLTPPGLPEAENFDDTGLTEEDIR